MTESQEDMETDSTSLINSVRKYQLDSFNKSDTDKSKKASIIAIMDAILKLLEDSKPEQSIGNISKVIEEINTRIQHCLIETIYANDRVECRQRYTNLRVSGLDLRKYKSPKEAVLGYSELHGVKMKQSQITIVKELREGDKYKPLLVSFDTAKSRELFIEAKFNAISARTKVAKKIQQLMDTDDEQNIATTETIKMNELYPQTCPHP